MNNIVTRMALSLLLALFATGTVSVSVAQAAKDGLFSDFARTILEGLNETPMESLPATNGYGAPRIAVRTVGAETPEIAATYTRQLLRALQKQARGRFGFVALDALDRLILDIKAEELSAAESNARIRDLRINARADVLVAGTLLRRKGETYLSYQAINTETGALLASTSSRRVNVTPWPTRRNALRTTAPARPSGYRDTVQEAEQLLFDKGYDPGPIDGYLSAETRAALRQYQQDSALPMNGRLTRQVVNNLRRDTRAIVF